jgi:hypothetical protein
MFQNVNECAKNRGGMAACRMYAVLAAITLGMFLRPFGERRLRALTLMCSRRCPPCW